MIIHEISDDFWRKVEPLLAPFKRTKPGGSPPRDFRSMLKILKIGCQWHFLPPCYGSKVPSRSTFSAGRTPACLRRLSTCMLWSITH
jgi:transposase